MMFHEEALCSMCVPLPLPNTCELNRIHALLLLLLLDHSMLKVKQCWSGDRNGIRAAEIQLQQSEKVLYGYFLETWPKLE